MPTTKALLARPAATRSFSRAVVTALLGGLDWATLQAAIEEGVERGAFRASTLDYLLGESIPDPVLRVAIRARIIPLRSWRRRTAGDQPLSATEVRRMTDLAEVVRGARDAYEGDAIAADVFLRTPRPEFHGRAPILMAAMDGGPQAVRELIAKLSEGAPV